MNHLEKFSLLLKIVQSLEYIRSEKQASPCGETHLQKAVFLMQELTDQPLGFKFVIYKHGPYSFDLNDELGWMFSYNLLDATPVEIAPDQYQGFKLFLTDAGKNLLHDSKETLSHFQSQIDFAANLIGHKNVLALEKLTTALFLKTKRKKNTSEETAQYLNRLKPHISVADALKALQEADHLIRESNQKFQQKNPQNSENQLLVT